MKVFWDQKVVAPSLRATPAATKRSIDLYERTATGNGGNIDKNEIVHPRIGRP